MIIVPLLERRPMWQTSFHFFTLVLILVFVNWGAPFALDKGLWTFIFTYKWYITGVLALMLCWSLVRILKLRPLWVCAGVVIVSVFLADALIAKAKLVPLVPMVVGIASLSIILLSINQIMIDRNNVFCKITIFPCQTDNLADSTSCTKKYSK